VFVHIYVNSEIRYRENGIKKIPLTRMENRIFEEIKDRQTHTANEMIKHIYGTNAVDIVKNSLGISIHRLNKKLAKIDLEIISRKRIGYFLSDIREKERERVFETRENYMEREPIKAYRKKPLKERLQSEEVLREKWKIPLKRSYGKIW
jgi:hypothetical protein